MTDQFFTPENIATSLMVGMTTDPFKVVADFTIGDGSLIKALPFIPRKSIGLDLDGTVIKNLKLQFPDWKLMEGDFLNPDQNTEKWLAKWVGKIDLILLNPPFSCKGGTFVTVEFNEQNLRCRTALAFAVNATKYLKKNGILIAILPLSVLKSKVDLIVLSHLKKEWYINTGTKLGRNTFPGCSPNSVILTLQKKKLSIVETGGNIDAELPLVNVEILRGCMPMYQTSEKGKYPILHTTNLKQGILNLNNPRFTDRMSRYVKGTFLIIPRVGNPTQDKIVIISNNISFCLSDCLFAVSSLDIGDITLVRSTIIKNWLEFIALYESTCAPYVTLDQLRTFFKKHLISLNVVERIDYKSAVEIKNNYDESSLKDISA